MKSTFANQAAVPAIPAKPKIPAMIATIRKTMAHDNIEHLLVLLRDEGCRGFMKRGSPSFGSRGTRVLLGGCRVLLVIGNNAGCTLPQEESCTEVLFLRRRFQERVGSVC